MINNLDDQADQIHTDMCMTRMDFIPSAGYSYSTQTNQANHEDSMDMDMDIDDDMHPVAQLASQLSRLTGDSDPMDYAYNQNLNQTQDIYLMQDVLNKLDRLNITIVKNRCVVCMRHTTNMVSNSCNSYCTYYCHPLCAARWVVTRLQDSVPYCMVCCHNYQPEQIPFLVSDQHILETACSMYSDTSMFEHNYETCIKENIFNVREKNPKLMAYLESKGFQFDTIE